jgi:LemA protein
MTFIETVASSADDCAAFLVLGLAIIAAFFFVVIFNSLVQMRNNVDKAWANIDVLLKKRLDLIPVLVAIVSGYVKYEQGVLVEITKIRASALQAQNIAEKAEGSRAVSESLKPVFALAENYPDLKASENFLSLQKELTTIENEISLRREFYNDTVLLYNTRLQTIPSRFIADLLRLCPKEYFTVKEPVDKPVAVTIGTG